MIYESGVGLVGLRFREAQVSGETRPGSYSLRIRFIRSKLENVQTSQISPILFIPLIKMLIIINSVIIITYCQQL